MFVIRHFISFLQSFSFTVILFAFLFSSKKGRRRAKYKVILICNNNTYHSLHYFFSVSLHYFGMCACKVVGFLFFFFISDFNMSEQNTVCMKNGERERVLVFILQQREKYKSIIWLCFMWIALASLSLRERIYYSPLKIVQPYIKIYL